MKNKVTKSERVFEGRAFSLRVDQVKLPTGQITRRDVLEHPGGVTILPVDSDGYIWFVRQYRHPAENEILELPAGALEAGENPSDCAHREIREEIGMRAGILQKIGECYLAPGYSSEYMYVFLATDLSPAPLPGDEDEIIEIEKYPVQKALEMAQNGLIQDAKTLAALFLAQPYIASK